MFQSGLLTYLRKNRISVLLAVVFIGLGVLKIKHDKENWQRGVVNSDGRGYFYFLPALASWNFDYLSVLKQEEANIGKSHQPYILKTESGRQVNKCYPGVAFLQLPSYILASSIDSLQGEKSNPYSDTHLYFFFWTTLLFLYLSLLYLRKCLVLYFNSEKYTWLAAILVVFGTNIAYQAFFYSGITHHYTFFVFTLWVFHLLRWKSNRAFISLIYLGFFTGILLLIRPTNGLLILFLPFLLRDWSSLKSFFQVKFTVSVKQIIAIVGAFIIPLSLLPLITYAQTDQLFYWSYQGEGFRWNDIHWLDTWISYRAGILWHTPLVFIGLLGLILGFRRWKYETISLFAAYSVLTLVLGAWWCWDYQLFFGHRGFTEYQLFTGFLLLFFLNQFKKPWIGIVIFIVPVFYMGIRTYQKITGIYSVQKFTATTYWKSILDLNSAENDRYVYFTNCQPAGKVLKTVDLMAGIPNEAEMNEKMQFWPAIGYEIPKQFENNRIFVEVKFNKQLKESEDWRDVIVVFAGKDKNDSIVHYAAYPAYNYVYEGKKSWVEHHIAEEFILNQDQTRKIIVYLWDLGNKSYVVRDFKAELKIIGN